MTIMNGAYINGLDDPANNAKTVAEAAGTATTDYILFSLTVHDTTTGDIYYGLGNDVVAANGAVTPTARVILDPVVIAGVTKAHCTKVWLSLGGSGSNTFTNMATILKNGGTTATNLINNLAALATSLKGLSSKITSVGFDMDNEDAPVAAVVPLIVALYNHGRQQSPSVSYPFTFCAYTDEPDWFDALASVYSALNGVQPVVGITLQVYAGGGGNDPATWTGDLAAYLQNSGKSTGLTSANGFILPIQSMDDTAPPTYSPQQMTSNLKRWQSTGGSVWATQALFQSSPAQHWSDYASAIASGISS